MSDCLKPFMEYQVCHGCDPQCNHNEQQRKAGYVPYSYNDPHNRSHGFHEAIYKILEKRLHLKSQDIARLCTFYQGPSKYRSGEDNYYLEVLIEIQKNAFFMGKLERSCEGSINFPHFYKGWFWIGQTRYEIWEVIR